MQTKVDCCCLKQLLLPGVKLVEQLHDLRDRSLAGEKRILKFLQNQKKSVHLQIRVEGHIAGGAVPPTVTAIVAVSTLAT